MTARTLTTSGRLGVSGFPRPGYPSASGRVVVQPIIVDGIAADTRDGGRDTTKRRKRQFARTVTRKIGQFERLRTRRDQLQRELETTSAPPPVARTVRVEAEPTATASTPLQAIEQRLEQTQALRDQINVVQSDMGQLRSEIEGFARARADEEEAVILLLAA